MAPEEQLHGKVRPGRVVAEAWLFLARRQWKNQARIIMNAKGRIGNSSCRLLSNSARRLQIASRYACQNTRKNEGGRYAQYWLQTFKGLPCECAACGSAVVRTKLWEMWHGVNATGICGVCIQETRWIVQFRQFLS